MGIVNKRKVIHLNIVMSMEINNYFGEYLIDKENSEVIYSDEKHVYLGKKDGSRYISVTQIIEKFGQEFDSEFWSKYKALELTLGSELFKPYKSILLKTKQWNDSLLKDIDKNKFSENVNKILADWEKENKDACEWGTKIHAEMENMFYDKPKEICKKYEIGENLKVFKNKHDILNYESGIFPEMLISYTSPDGKLKIAGQSDIIIKDGNKIKVWDFKTNKKLEFKSYFDSKNKKHTSMKYPLNNLMECNGVHYQLQLSIYGYLLKQINPEFEIEELRIIHFERSGETKQYVLDYIEKDVERMLSFYKKQCEYEEFKDAHKRIVF